DTLLSGPSGGISGAVYIAQMIDRPHIITFDMGGTSTDVSLIADGKVESNNCRIIGGLPIKSTAVDVHTVGAGGSSLAWLDGGGLLRVGPQSAGAKPGPACYGIGGVHPTVTDANVALDRLNQDYLLGGALGNDPPSPGVLCAMGVLTKDAQIDVSQTRILRQGATGLGEQMGDIFAALERRAMEIIRRGRLSPARVTFARSVEARYVGQNFELTVPVALDEQREVATASVRTCFDAAHRRFSGYDQPSKEMELVTFRLRASMPGPKLDLATHSSGRRLGALVPIGRRRVVFEASEAPIDCPV